MPDNNNNLINEYFDKSYITSILCELSYNYCLSSVKVSLLFAN